MNPSPPPSHDKVATAQVNYRAGGDRHYCAACINYRVPRHCVRVAGDILPTAICDLFGIDRYSVSGDGQDG
jgi:hypothetical protein